jgi:hypothetical protein
MSRLSTLSPAAIKAMFSSESSDVMILLLTLKADPTVGLASDIYLCDNYTQRILETADEVVYGTVSNGKNYIFLPLEITLPNDDNTAAPRCTITIHDVTRYLLPSIRSITGALDAELSLVLSSSPNTVETRYAGFKLTNVTYNANTVTAVLTMPSLEVEPFPAHAFTPAYFPGLF